jgi:hypothetical protein
MVLVARVRWARVRQGRRELPYQPDTGATEDEASRRSSAARRHSDYFAKPSY